MLLLKRVNPALMSGSAASALLEGEAQGLALDFTDDFFQTSSNHYGSARVKDTGTPANGYNSHPFGLLSYPGASKKWVMGPNGLLIESDPALTLPFEWDTNGDLLGIRIEVQRTNLFLNNRAPATQNITVTAAAHTLSFYGTGSITLSGAHSATLNGTGANDRVTLTFTPTAGTLTCTVSGSIDWVQVEVGSFATSPIETAGSTVTRAADNISLVTSRFPLSAEGTWFVKASGTGPGGIYAPALVVNDSGNTTRLPDLSLGAGNLGGAGSWRCDVFDNSVNQAALGSSAVFTPNTIYHAGFAYAEDDFEFVSEGTARNIDISGTVPNLNVEKATIGNRNNAQHLNGHISEVVYIARRMTQAEMIDWTAA